MHHSNDFTDYMDYHNGRSKYDSGAFKRSECGAPYIDAKEGDTITRILYGEEHTRLVTADDVARGYMVWNETRCRSGDGQACHPVFLRPRKIYEPGSGYRLSYSEF